ncbi:MAG: Glycerophosphodiester phosphodiesterase [Myxococcota bacterium]|nr:Glycerophosphodiester phosphodiesterase [Myxococcota bacterium]
MQARNPSSRQVPGPPGDWPPPGSPRPLLLAHRGASGLAPENTLQAFELARRSGVDGCEFDVRLCASGQPVVFHDPDLKRLCGAPGKVNQIIWSRLKNLRVLDSDQRIPLFEEVLDALGPDMLLDIELKSESLVEPELAHKVCRIVLRRAMRSRVIISSFNPLLMAVVRKNYPSLAAAAIYGEESPFYLRRPGPAISMGMKTVFVDQHILNPNRIQSLQAKGLAVHSWTVNTAERARQLAGAGIDGLIGNYPAALLEGAGRAVRSPGT